MTTNQLLNNNLFQGITPIQLNDYENKFIEILNKEKESYMDQDFNGSLPIKSFILQLIDLKKNNKLISKIHIEFLEKIEEISDIDIKEDTDKNIGIKLNNIKRTDLLGNLDTLLEPMDKEKFERGDLYTKKKQDYYLESLISGYTVEEYIKKMNELKNVARYGTQLQYNKNNNTTERRRLFNTKSWFTHNKVNNNNHFARYTFEKHKNNLTGGYYGFVQAHKSGCMPFFPSLRQNNLGTIHKQIQRSKKFNKKTKERKEHETYKKEKYLDNALNKNYFKALDLNREIYKKKLLIITRKENNEDFKSIQDEIKNFQNEIKNLKDKARKKMSVIDQVFGNHFFRFRTKLNHVIKYNQRKLFKASGQFLVKDGLTTKKVDGMTYMIDKIKLIEALKDFHNITKESDDYKKIKLSKDSLGDNFLYLREFFPDSVDEENDTIELSFNKETSPFLDASIKSMIKELSLFQSSTKLHKKIRHKKFDDAFDLIKEKVKNDSKKITDPKQKRFAKLFTIMKPEINKINQLSDGLKKQKEIVKIKIKPEDFLRTKIESNDNIHSANSSMLIK